MENVLFRKYLFIRIFKYCEIICIYVKHVLLCNLKEKTVKTEIPKNISFFKNLVKEFIFYDKMKILINKFYI